MKNRRNLFEVINKAPQIQQKSTRQAPSILSGLRRPTKGPSQPVVAKALTEEEAAAELAAARAIADAEARAQAEVLERIAREKEAKLAARAERKAARELARAQARESAEKQKAERAAARAAIAQTAAAASTGRGSKPLVVKSGKYSFAFNTANTVALAGLIVAVLIGVYLLGRRTADKDGVEITKVAALRAADFSISSGEPEAKSPSAGDSPEVGQRDPLAGLLQKPAAVLQNVSANQPQQVDAGQPVAPAKTSKDNYVQIEWFQITVEKSSEDLRAEVEDVHKFLKSRGIDTMAWEHPRGFILYSTRGFRMSREMRDERDLFLKKLRKLGQEYFKSGGRYQFKDCFFVSQSNATKGRPVTFKE